MNALNARNALSTQIIVALLLALAMPRLAEAGSNGSQKAVGPEAQQKLAKVQIPFIPNRGQSSKEVKFTARTFAGTVSVTETGGLVYSLPKLKGEKPVQGVTLKEELIGGKVKEVIGESQAVTRVSYFRGNDRSKWQSNLPSYDRVSLGEVYEGIDVKLKAYGNNVEKLFYVEPGAEPETIKMKLSGGKGVRVNASGELEVETEQGTVRFSKPIAYQEQNGKREPVEAAYLLRGTDYGFKVGDYDRTRELLIDPILAATYLGGSARNWATAITIDSAGYVYVAGSTNSSDFPGVSPGSADSTFEEHIEEHIEEAFVAKLNPDLSSVVRATYLGARNPNPAYGSLNGITALVLDNVGNVYALGQTYSANFPGVSPSSADRTFDGPNEIFLTKLNSDLSSILAGTFLGGSVEDFPNALTVDSIGNILVGGGTSSSDFPGIGSGSAINTYTRRDGFVAKLNPELNSILAATFLGSARWPLSLAVNTSGDLYAGGEGIVAKLNSDLSSILALTGFSGRAYGIALDTTGNVFICGEAFSPGFPGIGPGSADKTFAGIGEAFVAKLKPDLSSVLAATYMGGSGEDTAGGLAVDSKGDIYVSGYTSSSDFPAIGLGSADNTFAGIVEAYVAKLNSDLSSILAATFLGGSGQDGWAALALDASGNIYVAGDTNSTDFPGIGAASARSTFSFDYDAFVVKLDANLSAGPVQLHVVNDKVSFVVQSTSLSTTPVSGGPAGVYTITARLTNKSQQNIWEPIKAILKTLTNGNKLLNATEGSGGAGSKQAIDAGTDNILKPNESATVQFRIGLANRNRFEFFVDVWGIPSP